MLKGHTKIELTNVKTGNIKVIEEDNMVTNGMANAFIQRPNNYGALDITKRPFAQETPRSYQLCGGILLFNKPIEENLNTIFPPNGNRMIGNAVAGISSSSDVPEFGYFNAQESTWEWDGDAVTQKLVYDFGTSQGNGEISSVCLASMLAGYMGFGNHSGKRVANKIDNLDFNSNMFENNYLFNRIRLYFYPAYMSTNGTKLSGYPFMFDYEKNCIYTCSMYAFFNTSSDYDDEHVSTGTLKLQKYYFPMSSVNPLQYMSSFDYGNRNFIHQEYEIPIPSEITGLNKDIIGRTLVSANTEGTYLIIGVSNTDILKDGDTIYVLQINSALETKLYTLKNTTGKELRNTDYKRYASRYDYMAIKDGYLFCQSYKNSAPTEFFKINLKNSADVVSLGTYGTGSNYNLTLISNRLFIGTMQIIDDIENVILPVNSFLPNYTHIWSVCGCDFIYMTSYEINYSLNTSNTGIYLNFNPMYLATINNLSQPVTKTADMSMKITYTLTSRE